MLILIGHSLTGSSQSDDTHIMPQRYLVKVCMVQTHSTSNKHLHPKIADYILASTWLSYSLLRIDCLPQRYLVYWLPGTVCIPIGRHKDDNETRSTRNTWRPTTLFSANHTCLYIHLYPKYLNGCRHDWCHVIACVSGRLSLKHSQVRAGMGWARGGE